jgi:hypothetical protein
MMLRNNQILLTVLALLLAGTCAQQKLYYLSDQDVLPTDDAVS